MGTKIMKFFARWTTKIYKKKRIYKKELEKDEHPVKKLTNGHIQYLKNRFQIKQERANQRGISGAIQSILCLLL